MPSVKSIKQRIKSVKNTRQITKAMEAVSATKMRRSQRFALDGRPYALAALEMLGNVTQRTEYRPKLLAEREIKRAVLVVVTSDKGLAGAFNASVLRKAEAWIAEHAQQYPVDPVRSLTTSIHDKEPKDEVDLRLSSSLKKVSSLTSNGVDIITVGKKARDYFGNRKGNVIKEFLGFGDYAEPNETKPLSDFLLKGFIAHQWDLVEIMYTNFRTTLKQEVAEARIFPVNLEKIKQTIENIIPEHGRFANTATSYKLQATSYEYKLEPSAEVVLDTLIPHLIETQIFHMILESNASEHSARMVAMKNASENAGEIISELTLEYNKSRQAGITRELTEITAGKEALEG
ncbi:MAG: FoF1 ATP synthase subunit gamma [bacterium]|nr:FoF1 ATP synthase subunit gamma [bacterium]